MTKEHTADVNKWAPFALVHRQRYHGFTLSTVSCHGPDGIVQLPYCYITNASGHLSWTCLLFNAEVGPATPSNDSHPLPISFVPTTIVRQP